MQKKHRVVAAVGEAGVVAEEEVDVVGAVDGVREDVVESGIRSQYTRRDLMTRCTWSVTWDANGVLAGALRFRSRRPCGGTGCRRGRGRCAATDTP